ncbi:cupin domain-containing protein [Paenibacillus gansuensis]|uniref:Cupin domain-containing protein n=1 Tax=Paenibacillus gansuensis TaxID=306542 RepID=A0ABW5PEL7_9BACL
MTNHQSAPNERKAIVHRYAEREWITVFPGEDVSIRVKGEDVNGEYTFLDLVEGPGKGTFIHYHEEADEIIHIIEGVAHIHLDGKEFDAAAGDVIVAPRGVAHGFVNLTDSTLRMSIMYTPSGIENMFTDVIGKSKEEVVELVTTKYKTFIVGPLTNN